MTDILKDSPEYRWMTEEARAEGREEGIEEGIHLAILHLVAKRFPSVLSLVRAVLPLVNRRAILTPLFDTISVAQEVDVVRKCLWEAVEESIQ